MKLASVLARLDKIGNRLRIFGLRANGAKVDSSCYIGSNLLARLGLYEGRAGELCLAQNVRTGRGVVLDAFGGRISIAENVYIGHYSVIYGHGGVKIGRDSLIAMHCSIL